MKKETVHWQRLRIVLTVLCLLFSFSTAIHADDEDEDESGYVVADATLITDNGVTQIPMHFLNDEGDIFVMPYYNSDDDPVEFFPCIDPTLRGTLIIPEKVKGYQVKYIFMEAFKDCQIDFVRIPETVVRILPLAFKGCKNLQALTIPESVKYLYKEAFADCTSLTTLRLYGALEEPEQTSPNQFIDESAFSGCTALQTVVFGEKMKYIGHKWFRGCTALKSISIPDNVTYIGLAAFEQCENLEEVRLPAHLDGIETRCFSQCSNLKSINIPQEVKIIGYDAFLYCGNLSTVRIPEGVTAIRDYAFSGCTQLNSITLPSTLTTIGNYAFSPIILTDIYLCSTEPPTVSPNGYVFRLADNSKVDKLHVPDPNKYTITWLQWFNEIVKFDPIQEVVIEDFTWPDAGNYGDYDIYTSTPGSYVKEIRYTEWGPVDLTTTTFKKNTSYSVLIYVAPCNSGITIADDAPGYIRKSDGTLVQCDYVTNMSDGTKCYQFNIYVGQRQSNYIIPRVTVDWPIPVVGQEPSTDIVLQPYQDNQVGCEIYSAQLKVVNGDKVMEAGETFQSGETYQLLVLLQAESGYVFDNSTRVILNNHDVDLHGLFLTNGFLLFYQYFTLPSVPTDIDIVETPAEGSDAWYTIDGQRLTAAPTKQGIYIHQGKKVVVR